LIYLPDAISYWIGEQNDSFQLILTRPLNLILGDGLLAFLSYDTGVSHSHNETEPDGYRLCNITYIRGFWCQCSGVGRQI